VPEGMKPGSRDPQLLKKRMQDTLEDVITRDLRSLLQEVNSSVQGRPNSIAGENHSVAIVD
jgi:hypothetical protein